MRRFIYLMVAFSATVISSGRCFGKDSGTELDWTGFTSIRLGQIVDGSAETVVPFDSKSDMVWVQELNLGLNLEVKFDIIPATGNIGFEVSTINDYAPHENDLGTSRRLNHYFYPARADLFFDLAENDNTRLEFDVGFFPYKYNSAVRNLGEYLFRSGTYPQYVTTEFDFPMARLMGMRFGLSLTNNLDLDVLLTSNIEWTAIGDPNLSALFSWRPAPFIDLGLGGSWCSIISVDIDNTTPQQDASRYFSTVEGDSMIYHYTFAGQKVMGRFTFDPKKLVSSFEDIFGAEDLKIYAEAAILGVLDYPASIDGYTRYDTLMHRIPMMLGFNFPAFRILDVLSLEIEYWKNPYPNDLNPLKFDNLPVTLSSYANEKSQFYTNLHNDDWKWSIYFKKTIADQFYIRGQIASDHIKWYRFNYVKMDGKDAVRKTDEWYYTVKFGYSF